MPGFEKVRKNLEAHGFDVTCFDTAAEAADYLDRRLDGKTVGHGGSITLKEHRGLSACGQKSRAYAGRGVSRGAF